MKKSLAVRKNAFSFLAVAVVVCAHTSAFAIKVRIKDITTVQGVRDNQLKGIGLVAGLDNTGGKGETTRRLLQNFLQRQNLFADQVSRLGIATNTQLPTQNVAAVTVTADLPAFARRGARIDVSVSLMDGTSLRGGELVHAVLRGYDKQIYATASGPIILAGASAQGEAASVSSNHVTSGHVINGAIVERVIPFQLTENGSFGLLLKKNDFQTASRVADAINRVFRGAARAQDSARVDVIIPIQHRLNPVEFISQIQALEVEPDVKAQVVINEKTGTIVIGTGVKISAALVNHGNLVVTVAETPDVSQPPPFSQGVTAIVPRSDVELTEERNRVIQHDDLTTLGEIADALNALGATPSDLIAIIRELNRLGHIHAEVIVQ